MWATRIKDIKALALLGGLLFPGQAVAQAAEACGTAGTLLMYCSFDGGAKQVGVCLQGDTISYQFGANFNAPELTLASRITDLDHLPYSWANNKIYESVLLRNGDTTYEVFMATWRQSYPGPAWGGIIVTNPDQSQVTLECDHRSLVPSDPFDGIGELTLRTNGLERDPLSRCLRLLSGDIGPEACVGAFREAEVADGTCDQNPLEDLNCWRTESARWSELVDEAFENAMLRLGGPSLEASQRAWLMAQDVDCTLEGRYPFAPDAGVGQCLSENAAARLSFFSDVFGYAEFEG